ncbi:MULTISPECIES: hypothetical protein [unclassified Sphingomonas]|uniref:hypothetical protein n=1 Tax=Novosphingobium rhizosphaerae TaxID=1551649 RepID=UPI0015CA29CE
MGGINIYCGSFSGGDKSGSAFESVLMEMKVMASAFEAETIDRLKTDLDKASDHLLIQASDAKNLLLLTRRYCVVINAQLAAPGDPLDQIARDEARGKADPTDLKYGAGLGWRAYCANDLLKAFEAAEAGAEPVALVW